MWLLGKPIAVTFAGPAVDSVGERASAVVWALWWVAGGRTAGGLAQGHLGWVLPRLGVGHTGLQREIKARNLKVRCQFAAKN